MNIVISVEFIDGGDWHPAPIAETEDPVVAMNALLNPECPKLKRNWIVSAREESRLLGFAVVRNGKRRRMEYATLQNKTGKLLTSILLHYAEWIDPTLDFEQAFLRQSTPSVGTNLMEVFGVYSKNIRTVLRRVFLEVFTPQAHDDQTLKIVSSTLSMKSIDYASGDRALMSMTSVLYHSVAGINRSARIDAFNRKILEIMLEEVGIQEFLLAAHRYYLVEMNPT